MVGRGEARMEYLELKEFIEHKMRMSHIYQPLLILTLLESDNAATMRQLAIEFAGRDEVQIEDYKKRIKNMPVKVLKNHEVVSQEGELVKLNIHKLSLVERSELKMLCEQKIQGFIMNRNIGVWDYKLMDNRNLSDKLRERLLIEAKGRCALCGRTKNEDQLEIDHIQPVSKGGKTIYENLQVLCKKCNGTKSNKHNYDFREMVYETKETCLFCEIESDQYIIENAHAYVLEDKFPVTKGHSLIIPKRHVADYFELSQEENNALFELVKIRKKQLTEEDPSIEGFNVGINVGQEAGQTVFHVHVHLIPRRKGDVEDPEGGVRGVVPGKRRYVRY